MRTYTESDLRRIETDLRGRLEDFPLYWHLQHVAAHSHSPDRLHIGYAAMPQNGKGMQFIMMEQGGTALGIDIDGTFASVEKFIVDEFLEGYGIGRQLWNIAEATAYAEGCDRIQIQCSGTARPIFSRFGLEEVKFGIFEKEPQPN